MNPLEFGSACFDPDQFSGKARLFPIPNLVMFPHVVQPLHVFEERYREMIEEALAGDGLIAMPVLKPGWEPEYASRPAVEPWACLGQIVLHNELPDGCFNLLLLGLARVKIERELDPVRSFRQAAVSLIDEFSPPADDLETDDLRQDLVAAFRCQLSKGQAPESLRQLLDKQFALGQLTDLMSYALPLKLAAKLELLAEPCAKRRGEKLLGILEKSVSTGAAACSGDRFPPPFSLN